MHPRPRPSSARAFTLIELIVTVVILGVLAALAVPAFGAVIERAEKNGIEQASLAMGRELVALAAFDEDFPDEGADGGSKAQRIQQLVGEVSDGYDYARNEQTIVGSGTFDIGAGWEPVTGDYLVNLSPFSPSPVGEGILLVVDDADDNGGPTDGERCLRMQLPATSVSPTIVSAVDGDSAWDGGANTCAG